MNNKKNKQTKTRRHRQQYGGDQREAGGVVKNKGGQICGDARFDFRWWVHRAVCRWRVTELYNCNLHNFVNQYYPNAFNFKKADFDSVI